jgi:hypothetical protein
MTEAPATRSPPGPGVTCDVYEEPDGRQWVVGYDGERVYGVWLHRRTSRW